jgi:hypothetical protein
MTDKIFIQINDKVEEAKEETLQYIEAWKAEANQVMISQLEAEALAVEAKLSGISKLEALGLSQIEIAALLGISIDNSTDLS